MDKKKCKNCWFEGIEKCFLYDKKYKKIKKCNQYILDPVYKIENENLKKSIDKKNKI